MALNTFLRIAGTRPAERHQLCKRPALHVARATHQRDKRQVCQNCADDQQQQTEDQPAFLQHVRQREATCTHGGRHQSKHRTPQRTSSDRHLREADAFLDCCKCSGHLTLVFSKSLQELVAQGTVRLFEGVNVQVFPRHGSAHGTAGTRRTLRLRNHADGSFLLERRGISVEANPVLLDPAAELWHQSRVSKRKGNKAIPPTGQKC
mmetsp:Transcript_52543/g.139950  ORF Transcript_52543/g.139950 Transcript_52543/m.139950 type:complete len:206 (-) Transcript_52543:47-664(-)